MKCNDRVGNKNEVFTLSLILKSAPKSRKESLGEFLGLRLSECRKKTFEVLTLSLISRKLTFPYYLNTP